MRRKTDEYCHCHGSQFRHGPGICAAIIPIVQVDEIWAIARRESALEGLKTRGKVPVRPVALVKLVPHSLLMKIWLNQQKHAKNNEGLTSK